MLLKPLNNIFFWIKKQSKGCAVSQRVARSIHYASYYLIKKMTITTQKNVILFIIGQFVSVGNSHQLIMSCIY